MGGGSGNRIFQILTFNLFYLEEEEVVVVVVVVVVVGEGRQSMSQIIAAKSTNGLGEGEGRDTGRLKIKNKGQAPGGWGRSRKCMRRTERKITEGVALAQEVGGISGQSLPTPQPQKGFTGALGSQSPLPTISAPHPPPTHGPKRKWVRSWSLGQRQKEAR